MLIELPTLWIGLLNVAAWLIIQFGLAWGLTLIPAGRFHPRGRAARLCRWEQPGLIYEKVFAIKLWKDRLPDAAGWFRSGFPKASLRARTPDYYERFLRETWRGELVHWLALFAIPVFALWNPPWAVAVNAVYAMAANLPCLLVQRYNRGRLLRLPPLAQRQ